jgi:hypothetical protein
MMSPPLETGNWLSLKAVQDASFILLDTVSREKFILLPFFPSIRYEAASGVSEAGLFFMSFQAVEPISDKGNS